jgi:hypothetical protein
VNQKEIGMPERRKYFLAIVFSAAAIAGAGIIGLMVAGRLRIDSEWPGLVIGLGALVLILAVARR